VLPSSSFARQASFRHQVNQQAQLIMPTLCDRNLRDYVSAAEAMEMLHVRAQTLYAYVSRGLIHSVAQKGVKDKLYLRDDINRVGKRTLARSGHGAVAASAMDWGEPIFPTSITEITPEGPRYRGHLASELVAAGVSFESVAQLLWTGELTMSAPLWPVRRASADIIKITQTLGAPPSHNNLLEAFGVVLLLLGMRRGPVAHRLLEQQTLLAARDIMHTVVGCCGLAGPARQFRLMRKGESMVQGLLASLSLEATGENSEALRTVLILMADHELPPGTLSARVVASSGGTLHSCLASALCATSGAGVGRLYDRVEEFLGHGQTAKALVEHAGGLLKQGQSLPGFGHPLYPKGDPRAAQLLDIARRRELQTRESRALFRFIDAIEASTGLRPRQEFALVVLARSMGLPPQATAALFVMGRLAGWVAHVQEQREACTLLRPRARFVAQG
jgi:citrate synthase